MNTALSWIKAYVPELVTEAQEYADRMTLTGTKVEGFEKLDKNLEKIVIGQILSIEKHPDADKLIVCQVDVGGETIQIVTGAPNVAVGDKVPVVLDGGKVANGHSGEAAPENGIKIKKGKLRGVESFGMMCSIEELGSSREFFPDAPENGIYILDADAPVGADAPEYMGLRDVVFEYEITSNRVDCYSVLGIAREAAATYGLPFVSPVPEAKGNDENAADYIKVTVEDPDLCPRYTARVVKNIKLAPSPKWMQQRLAACGIRPINNLVDITNYVMEEYGQPMHAYDLSTIAGNEIIVRRAKDGDVYMTLDGQERTLDSETLMICDGEKYVGIAGIMGGENSKIADGMQNLLFEAACFNGVNIRHSAKKLGMRTEASALFEKGLDPNNAEQAMNRACQLIEELGCGEVVGGMVDFYPEPVCERNIPLEVEKINSLLGTDISKEEMLSYFKPLELAYDETTNLITIPTWRQDLYRMADIAEEVARFYGYDKIAVTLPGGGSEIGKLSAKLTIEKSARELAEFAGFSQAFTYSFESPKVFDKLLLPEDHPLRKAITIANPLGEDYSVMRTSSVNGMLTSLALNYNRRNKNVRLYELGNVYLPEKLPLTKLPDERMQFTLGFYGEGDFFSLKGVCEEFFEKMGMRAKPHYSTEKAFPFLHPGRQAEILYEGEILGYLGEIHPDVAENYGIGEKTYIAVIDMPVIMEKATYERRYESLAKFPQVSRDLSMVMAKEIPVGRVEDVIEKNAGKYLENLELFDVYEGSQIQAGFKSVAYSLTFRAADHTLSDDEINPAMEKIIAGLTEIGVTLRA